MRYFVGVRSETANIALNQDIEIYLYDYKKQEVRVEPYSKVKNELIYLWDLQSKQFETVLPSIALNSIACNDYIYMTFNSQNECISEPKLLVVGEHPKLGIHILDYKFEAHNVSYTEFQLKWAKTYNFVNPLRPNEISKIRLPLLRSVVDAEKEAETVRQLELLLGRKTAMFGASEISKDVIDVFESSLIHAIVSMSKDGAEGFGRPLLSLTRNESMQYKLLLMDDPDYFKDIATNKRLYISFPPAYAVGVAAWKGYGAIRAISFNRMDIISGHSFEECENLKYVFLPENCRYCIEDGAFSRTPIEEIRITAGAYKIHKYAFANCDKLKRIIVEDSSQLKDSLRELQKVNGGIIQCLK